MRKIIIDIDEETYNNFVIKNEYSRLDVIAVHNALRHGIPIPDNTTNGDMFCTIFNINDVVRNEYRSRVLYENYWEIMGFSNIWWDKPYNKKWEDKK